GILGFGIRDVKHVVLVDENPARPSELFPCGDELAVLVEDHNTAVAAVGDKQPAPAIKGEHMWALQFAVARAQMTEALDELPALVEFHDARIAEGRRVAFGDEDVTIRRKRDSRRPVEGLETR